MYLQKKVVVVLPAYNAAQTLLKTYQEIPFDIVDEVILVDDASSDGTAILAKEIGISHVILHQKIKDMVEIKNLVTIKHSRWAQTLSLCYIPIINTRPN